MNKERSSLTVDVRPGESIRLSPGPDVSIELVHKSGQLARLRFDLPREVIVEKIRGDIDGLNKNH